MNVYNACKKKGFLVFILDIPNIQCLFGVSSVARQLC